MNDIHRSERTLPTVVYICYLIAFLSGLSMLVGVVIAYVSRRGAEGKWYRSHYDYQISVFWKSLIGVLLAIATMWAFGFGVLVIICTYIWVLIKSIKGLSLLSERKEIEAAAFGWRFGPGRIRRKGG